MSSQPGPAGRSTDRVRPASDDFSLALGRAVAERLGADPEAVLSTARRNLATMRRANDDGSAEPWFDAWNRLLDGPVEGVVAVLTTDDEHGRTLRQNNPFAGVLPNQQRWQLLREVRKARDAARPA